MVSSEASLLPQAEFDTLVQECGSMFNTSNWLTPLRLALAISPILLLTPWTLHGFEPDQIRVLDVSALQRSSFVSHFLSGLPIHWQFKTFYDSRNRKCNMGWPPSNDGWAKCVWYA